MAGMRDVGNLSGGVRSLIQARRGDEQTTPSEPRSPTKTMYTPVQTPVTVPAPAPELELVDLDDLRSAFGGSSTGTSDSDTTTTSKTIMCANW